jgi:hypothetical protein
MSDYENENIEEDDIDLSMDKKKVDYVEQAFQLIEFHGNNFTLNTEALEIISSIEEEIIVVAVVGKARTGKSYLMNLLLDNVGKSKGVSFKYIKFKQSFK